MATCWANSWFAWGVGRAVRFDVGKLFVHVLELVFKILVHIFVGGQTAKRRLLIARLNLNITGGGNLG